MASAPTEADLLRLAAKGSRPDRGAVSGAAKDPLTQFSAPALSSTVLVAEDDADTRKLIIHLLRRAGYDTVEAEDGFQALALLKEMMPGLVLLDCQMPRMSGFEVCQQLKENPELADVPVIFLTALSDPQDKARGFEVGGEDYVTKPIEQRELLARIRSRMELAISRHSLRRKASLFEAVSLEQEDRLRDVRSGQASLLTQPEAFPDLKLAVRFQPAHEAGGDFYEIARLSEDDFGFLVSDVSGHDLSVPYVTGALKALAATFLNESLTPLETMSLHNCSLLKFLSEDRYVTACYARFSKLTMEVEVASAAHPPALRQTADGQLSYVHLVGDVLGMFEPAIFESHRFPVVPGERLFLYTDGLIEGFRGTAGQQGVLWGMKRLEEAIADRQLAPIDETVNSVVEELLAERGGSADDDIVLMGVEF
jgi:phosphoserine phosphatase RsbU/P